MAESWTIFILGWFPFYSWIRLFFFSYLVLPQTQGARSLYQEYVDPFLEHHEREIEEFIGRSHERAKALGLQYFYQALDYIRENILGLPAQRPASPPPPTGPAAYAQSLLSRFNVPTATGGTAPAVSNDWLSAIGSAVASVASGKSAEARGEELSASGTLLPREVASMSRADKAKFISNQKDLLEVLRSALAKEERDLHSAPAEVDDLAYGSPLRKNRSENSFTHVEHEDTQERSSEAHGRTSSGNWASGWFGAGEHAESSGADHGHDGARSRAH
ncbi:hypothetical protein AbraIFM66950_011175 [Aspergillus brasiliensis]|nr:hypothetical protein AbraIFM66950_011175 [Aspergillus brasiliensis]